MDVQTKMSAVFYFSCVAINCKSVSNVAVDFAVNLDNRLINLLFSLPYS